MKAGLVRRRLVAFLRDERGATAIEYGLIAALVGVAIIVAVAELGVTIGDLYGGVKDKVNAKMPQ
jgi:pilus assembly protein Flp/PilA